MTEFAGHRTVIPRPRVPAWLPPPRPPLPARAAGAWRRHGPLRFLRLCAKTVYWFLSGKTRRLRYIDDDRFDRRYGTWTSGAGSLDHLGLADEIRAQCVDYEVCDPAWAESLFDRAGLCDKRHYAFIDIGSGKGRVLLMAALAGFRRIIGVELDPVLCEVAAWNAERIRAHCPGADFTLVDGDARDFAFPEAPTICFMNNPFDAGILVRVLDNLEASLRRSPREFILLYLHAFHAGAIRARRGWLLLDQGHFRRGRKPFAIFRWCGEGEPVSR